MIWALVECDLRGDEQPIGSQQRFAKRHSLFSSFAWVDLGLACRSMLQARQKEWRKYINILNAFPKPSLQSHPCPAGTANHVSSPYQLVALLGFASFTCLNCSNPGWHLIQLCDGKERSSARHTVGAKSQDFFLLLFSEREIDTILPLVPSWNLNRMLAWICIPNPPAKHTHETDTTEDIMEYFCSLPFRWNNSKHWGLRKELRRVYSIVGL